MSCKGLVQAHKLIDFVQKNNQCSVRDVHQAFPEVNIKDLGKRLNRMAERGLILRRFIAGGKRIYSPVVRDYKTTQTLYNPRYRREIVSVFNWA